MMSFNLPIQFANVTNSKHRTESDDEEKQLTIYLTASLECEPSVLGQFSAEDEKIDYAPIMHDKKGMLQANGLKELVFDRKYEDHTFSLSFSGVFTDQSTQFFKGVEIKAFKAAPINGNMIKLIFTVKINPLEQDILMLSETIIKPCYIGIEGPSQLDLVEKAQREAEDE